MMSTTRLRSRRGASVTEYALALGAIALLLMAGLGSLEDGLTSELDERGGSIGQPTGVGYVAGSTTTTTATTTTLPPVTTTTPVPTTTAAPGTVSVSGLASAASWSGQKWVATVEVTVIDGLGNPVTLAEVEAEWSETFISETTCTTDASGTCTMTQWNLNKNRDDTTWSVVTISAPPLTYDPVLNVVSEIIVNKP